MSAGGRSKWQRRLDVECPYQVVLPRGPLGSDGDLMEFLTERIGKFDMYVDDDYAVFIRYCFADPADAAEFRCRFEDISPRLKLAS
jgi:hypothetical protein